MDPTEFISGGTEEKKLDGRRGDDSSSSAAVVGVPSKLVRFSGDFSESSLEDESNSSLLFADTMAAAEQAGEAPDFQQLYYQALRDLGSEKQQRKRKERNLIKMAQVLHQQQLYADEKEKEFQQRKADLDESQRQLHEAIKRLQYYDAQSTQIAKHETQLSSRQALQQEFSDHIDSRLQQHVRLGDDSSENNSSVEQNGDHEAPRIGPQEPGNCTPVHDHLQHLRDVRESKNAALQHWQAQFSHVTETVTNLRLDLEHKTHLVDDLRAQVESHIKLNDDLRNTVELMKEQIATLEAEKATQTVLKEQLQQQLTDLETRLEETQTSERDTHQYEDLLAQLEAEVHDRQEQLSEQEQVIHGFEQHIMMLQNEIQAQRDRYDANKRVLNEEHLNAVEQMVVQHAQAHQEWQSARRDLEQELQSCQQQLQQKLETRDGTKLPTTESPSDQVEKLKEELKEWREHFDSIEHVVNLENDLEELRGHYEERLSESTILQECIFSMKEKAALISAQMEEYRLKYEVNEQELHSVRQSNESLRDQVSKLQHQIFDWKSKYDSYIIESERAVRGFENSVSTWRSRYDSCQNELLQLRESNELLSVQVTNLKRQIDGSEERMRAGLIDVVRSSPPTANHGTSYELVDNEHAHDRGYFAPSKGESSEDNSSHFSFSLLETQNKALQAQVGALQQKIRLSHENKVSSVGMPEDSSEPASCPEKGLLEQNNTVWKLNETIEVLQGRIIESEQLAMKIEKDNEEKIAMIIRKYEIELENVVDTNNASAAAVQEQLDARQLQLVEAQEIVHSLNQQIETLENEILAVTDRHESVMSGALHEQDDAVKAMIDKHSEITGDLENKIKYLDACLLEVTDANETLIRQNEELEQEVSRLKIEVRTKVHDLTVLYKKEVDMLNQQLIAQTADTSATRESIMALEKKTETYALEMARLNERLTFEARPATDAPHTVLRNMPRDELASSNVQVDKSLLTSTTSRTFSIDADDIVLYSHDTAEAIVKEQSDDILTWFRNSCKIAFSEGGLKPGVLLRKLVSFFKYGAIGLVLLISLSALSILHSSSSYTVRSSWCAPVPPGQTQLVVGHELSLEKVPKWKVLADSVLDTAVPDSIKYFLSPIQDKKSIIMDWIEDRLCSKSVATPAGLISLEWKGDRLKAFENDAITDGYKKILWQKRSSQGVYFNPKKMIHLERRSEDSRTN